MDPWLIDDKSRQFAYLGIFSKQYNFGTDGCEIWSFRLKYGALNLLHLLKIFHTSKIFFGNDIFVIIIFGPLLNKVFILSQSAVLPEFQNVNIFICLQEKYILLLWSLDNLGSFLLYLVRNFIISSLSGKFILNLFAKYSFREIGYILNSSFNVRNMTSKIFSRITIKKIYSDI